MDLIIAFGLGAITAAIVIYLFIMLPDMKSAFNHGYDSGFLDGLDCRENIQHRGSKKDEDNSL